MHGLPRSTRFDWRRPVGAVIAAGALPLRGWISWANFLESLGSTSAANAQVAVTSGRLPGAKWRPARPIWVVCAAGVLLLCGSMSWATLLDGLESIRPRHP